MALADDIKLDDGLVLPDWEYNQSPSELRWRSRNLDQSRTTFRLTERGHLYECKQDMELNWSGEHPQREVHDEWWEEREDFTRTFTMRATMGEEFQTYEVRFLDGIAERFVRIR